MFDIFDRVAGILQEAIPMPLVVLTFFLCYLLTLTIIEGLVQKEKKKREQIQNKVDEIIKEYEGEIDWDKESRNKLRFLRYVSLYSKLNEEQMEEVRNRSNAVAKEYKAKPFILITALVVQILIFAMPLLFFATTHIMKPIEWFPIITAILSVSQMIARKRYIFSIIMGIISYYIYSYMSMEANIFIALKWIHLLFVFLFTQIKDKKLY